MIETSHHSNYIKFNDRTESKSQTGFSFSVPFHQPSTSSSRPLLPSVNLLLPALLLLLQLASNLLWAPPPPLLQSSPACSPRPPAASCLQGKPPLSSADGDLLLVAIGRLKNWDQRRGLRSPGKQGQRPEREREKEWNLRVEAFQTHLIDLFLFAVFLQQWEVHKLHLGFQNPMVNPPRKLWTVTQKCRNVKRHAMMP